MQGKLDKLGSFDYGKKYLRGNKLRMIIAGYQNLLNYYYRIN